MTALRAVRWSFDGDSPVIHRGFTDDTTWNGALNVWVDAETLAAVKAEIQAGADAYPGSVDPLTFAELDAMQPDAAGLYSLANGYMAMEVQSYASLEDAPLCECGEYHLGESDDDGATYYAVDGIDSTGTDAPMTWHTEARCSKGKRS